MLATNFATWMLPVRIRLDYDDRIAQRWRHPVDDQRGLRLVTLVYAFVRAFKSSSSFGNTLRVASRTACIPAVFGSRASSSISLHRRIAASVWLLPLAISAIVSFV